ncbi:LPD7 domain-containing protein [Paraburkholderia megapolitana]|uniref:LPD7 domain-containing protein n=1 Tax=Paraburkholderia megapolitana TaxID=420953 RepID=UPI0038B85CB0
MLIRISGHHDGVKVYLEEGRKVGREFSRDEMDERVVLDGDLDITDAIIQAIEAAANVDRYLTITLSFREDSVDRETLDAVVREFKAFVFTAWRPDELNFYAEAHLPRVKSYIDEKTGLLVERKPHIHIVIPKLNLISGQGARPFGFDKLNLDYIDAIQEHLNAKYGLASPKDHRRTELTDSSEMISRYRGDLFRPAARALKEQLLDAVLDQRIESWPAFEALLAARGAFRMRNAGSEDAYPNIKVADADKGVNLKDYVFSRAFIELPTDRKFAQLSADVASHYEERQSSRATPAEVQALLDEWSATRAREVKYLNSGNTRQWERYQHSSPADRRLMLDELERGFYSQHVKEFHDDDSGFRQLGPDDIEHPFDVDFDAGWSGIDIGIGPDDGSGPGPAPGLAPGSPGADRDAFIDAGESGASTGEPEFVAESFDVVRTLSGGDLDGVAQGRAVFLPDPAHDDLDDAGALSAYSLRRSRDRDREIASERSSTGRVADSAIAQHARDAHEARRQASGTEEFAEIRLHLGAARLLAELSHSHGVLPQKYVITTGRDGGERIRAGRRNLNVSDFLTKELNLPWHEAAPLLREVYARQRAGAPAPRMRELPRAALWREYASDREARSVARRAVWDRQRQSERSRRADIASELTARREAIRLDRNLMPRERTPAIAAARINRAAADTALGAAIRRERDVLKVVYGDAAGPSFADWLQERAQNGDERALVELRRTGKPVADHTPGMQPVGSIRPAAAAHHEDNAILFNGSGFSLSVDEGGRVTYRLDGQPLVVDRGDAVDVLQVDRAAIETGLRLAQLKFGRTLDLDGSAAFQQAAIEVAAAAGLSVQFSNPDLNHALRAARTERVDAQLADVRRSLNVRDDAPGAPTRQPAADALQPSPASQPRSGPNMGGSGR